MRGLKTHFACYLLNLKPYYVLISRPLLDGLGPFHFHRKHRVISFGNFTTFQTKLVNKYC